MVISEWILIPQEGSRFFQSRCLRNQEANGIGVNMRYAECMKPLTSNRNAIEISSSIFLKLLMIYTMSLMILEIMVQSG